MNRSRLAIALALFSLLGATSLPAAPPRPVPLDDTPPVASRHEPVLWVADPDGSATEQALKSNLDRIVADHGRGVLLVQGREERIELFRRSLSRPGAEIVGRVASSNRAFVDAATAILGKDPLESPRVGLMLVAGDGILARPKPARPSGSGVGPATTLPISDGFEGSASSSAIGPWDIYVAVSGQPYLWGRTSCDKSAGSYSADSTRGGGSGSTLSCTANYGSNYYAWLQWNAQLNLAGATAPTLRFVYRGKTSNAKDGDGYYMDYFLYQTSVDNNTGYGWGFVGDWSDRWYEVLRDMTAWDTFGDLRGIGDFYFWFMIASTSSAPSGYGFRVDDFSMTDGGGSTCTYSDCSATVPATATVGVPINVSATVARNNCTGTPTWSWQFGETTAHIPGQNISYTFTNAGTWGWNMLVFEGDAICTKSGTIVVTSGGGGCPPTTWTTSADFDRGILSGAQHTTTADQLQLSAESSTFPFIWIPNSDEQTISKLDTLTGNELGRYRTGPADGTDFNPSRTTVDLYGNCWVGNRGAGTVVKVGLLEKGQCVDRNGNGLVETSRDLNGDGNIQGSELLAWGSDECALYEVVLIDGKVGTYLPGQYSAGYSANYPRAVAVDSSNNVWAGVYNDKKFYYINSSTGQVTRTVDVTATGTTPYGAVIDRSGNLWSASWEQGWVLRINPTTGEQTKFPLAHASYGLGVDKLGHLFVSGWYGNLSRINISTGAVDWSVGAGYGSRGICVTDDNDVWVAATNDQTVRRYGQDGTLKATISTAPVGPTGVAVDAAGKIWAMGQYSENAVRINPATNTVELSKPILGSGTGEAHYSYSDMTGIVARTVTTRIGTWTVVHDSGSASTAWGTVSWNGSTPASTSIVARVRSSSNQTTWSSWENASNGTALSATPVGRYLQIEVTLQSALVDVTPVLYDLTVRPGGSCASGPTANFTWSPTSPTVGQSVQFTDTSTGSPTSWSWSFGDGGTSSQQNPSHPFSAAGTYSVVLVATNSGGSDSETKSITVTTGGSCSLSCTATVPSSGVVGTSVSFAGAATATGCGGSPAYYWDFGDMTAASSLQNPTHTYASAGTWYWQLTVTAPGAPPCVKSGAITITTGGSCSLSCTATVPSSGTVGTAVAFSSAATATGCSGSPAYYWDFGDMTSASNLQNPTHTYASAGTWYWLLTVTVPGAAPCVKSGSITITTGGGATCSGSYVYFVPAGAHAAGTNGTSWVTDMTLSNEGGSTATVSLLLLERDKENSNPAGIPVTVNAGAQLEILDVFLSRFGRDNVAAALRVCSNQPLLVMSRTYNQTAAGTFGQGIPGYPVAQAIASGERAKLTFLYEGAKFRTNIGFVNTTSGTVTVNVDFFNSSGAPLGTKPYTLRAYEYVQKTRIFTEVTGSEVVAGSAVIRPSGGGIFAYASLVDNATGDPTYMNAEK
jgi:PKD repeat protein